MKVPILAFTTLALLGCGKGMGERRHMESYLELKARQDRYYAASPDIQVPELRTRLVALGIPDRDIRTGTDDTGVTILRVAVDDSTYARLDKAALAKLQLDSRFRFELTNPKQRRPFAVFTVAEMQSRDKLKAIRELAEKGETDKIPRYRNSMSMLAYARSVEDYCGYAPGGAFQIVDGKWLNFTHKMVRDAAAAAAEQRSWASFACVKRIVEATDLGRYFIGNRARSQPRPAV